MRAVLDDHLLRRLIVDRIDPALGRLLRTADPATTNLYLYRLTRSVVRSGGGQVSSGLLPEERRALAARLADLTSDVQVLPMRSLTSEMATVAERYRLSTLGAEAVVASEQLRAPLCVDAVDVGPRLRDAVRERGGEYRTIGQ